MRTVAGLYVLALVVRLVLIAGFPDPAYPDSFYYVDVARALARGDGFHIDVIWIFAEVGGKLPAVPVLPIPSNAHWMPLASIIQVPFIWLLGPTAIASALPFAFTGATAGPLAWAIARDAKASPSVALAAGILTAIPGLSLVYMVQPDNFSLYQPLVAGALWMTARGPEGASPLVRAGRAACRRRDPLAQRWAARPRSDRRLAFAYDRWRRWRELRGPAGWTERPIRDAIPWASLIAAIGLFAVAIGPWYLRQLAVFGSLSPSTASGKVFFIRDIGEWNSITTPATLDHLLSQGLGPLLASRIGGLVAAITIFSVLVGVVLLMPLMVIGGGRGAEATTSDRSSPMRSLLFAFSAIVSAIHVPGGTFIHSAVALAPHGYILALEGIAVGVGWVAARRRTWRPAAATRVFTSVAVGFTLLAAGFGAVSVHGTWDIKRTRIGGRVAGAAAGGLEAVRSIDVDRCLRLSLCQRPPRRRPCQRPTRHDPPGRGRVRHPLPDPGARGRRPGDRAHPGRHRARVAGDADRGRAGGIARHGRHGDLPGPRHGAQPVSRREAVASAVVIFAVALAVRVLAASMIVFPKPEDTAYYVGVARNLVEGRGLVSDALWSFQTPPLHFPRDAFEVWLPLPSLLAALPMLAVRGNGQIPLDVAFRAAQVASVVIGALVPVLAWRLAADVAAERGLPIGRARTLAVGAGLATAVYLPVVLHSALPDSTMPFAVLALAGALLMTRILRDPRGGRLTDPRLLALGVLIGLAALTRNEAAWIGAAWALWWSWRPAHGRCALD